MQMDGIVRFFDPSRHFGFIQPLVGKPDSTPDVYFHASAVQGGACIPAGAEVSFRVVRGDKGPQAADVTMKQRRLPREHVLVVRGAP
jgi:CspA family cold shock protein